MRDNFNKPTKETLAKRVCYHCSNPSCDKITVGPHSDSTKSTLLGVAAHITAAAPKGPRYDLKLNIEERIHADNGIWLCVNCSTIIDKDPDSYPVQLLNNWKAQAEKRALDKLTGEIYKINRTNPRPIIELDLLYSHSGRSPKGISEDNFTDGNRVLQAGQDYIQFWDLTWNYKLVLMNNSTLPAFNVSIEQISGVNQPYVERINKKNNIPPYKVIESKLKITEFFKGYHSQADILISKDIPPVLSDVKFKIKYCDETRNEFTTIVDFNNDEINNVI